MSAREISIKATGGEKYTVTVDSEEMTVKQLKEELEKQCNIPADSQRLIYKGYVLRDQRTVDSYSIQNGHTVLLVKGRQADSSSSSSADSTNAATGASASATTNTSSAAITSTSAPSSTTPSTTTGVAGSQPPSGQNNANPLAAMMGMGGLGGMGGMGMMDPMAMQQQLLQNPDMMREMMNSPIVQSLMSNPELMQQLIMANPQMRQLMESNPQLAHVLNDPQVLRQSMELARNPELMRER